MSQDLLNDVKSTIRAVLTSSATVLGLNELSKDYKLFGGSDVPYRQLGYSSLLEFLRAIPDAVQLNNPGSPRTSIYPVSDSKTEHINQLIQGQKTNSGKSRGYSRGPPRPAPRRFGNFTPRPMRNLRKEEPITDAFRQDVLRVLENKPEGLPVDEFDYQMRRVSYNHCLALPDCEIKDDLNKFIYVEDGRVFLRKDNPMGERKGEVHVKPPGLSSHLEFSASDSEDELDMYSHYSNESDEYVAETRSHTQPRPELNSIDTKSEIPSRVVRNIQTLLQAAENRNGIWLRDFPQKYLMKFNYDLIPENYGFDDALELVGSLKHVVQLKRYRIEGDHLLVDASIATPVVREDNGIIPMSFINTLKKILSKRTTGSLSTNDLSAEYKRHSGCTLDPKEFGFSSMDSFLKSLDECCSDLCFRPVGDRFYIRLNSIPLDTKSRRNGNVPAVLPNGPTLDPFPLEVCHPDSKLPPNPFFGSLEKDDVFPAVLAEVYTPWAFFIHYEDDVPVLNRLMDDLNSFYVENEKEYEVTPTYATKGLLCAATYSLNGKWHRVSIISTKLKIAKVRFVDYGTTEEVNMSKLRYLHRDFADLPAMSIKAKLTCVQPKNIVDVEARKEHSAKVNHFFYDIVSRGDLKAKFINFDAKNDFYEISLQCSPPNLATFSLSDYLFNEDLVDIRSDEFAAPPAANATSSFFTPESLQPTKKTEQRPHSRLVNGGTTEKPTSPSTSPVAPVVSPPPAQPSPAQPPPAQSPPAQPPPAQSPPQKGPPPGLSLPTGAQSQNCSNLFSPPLISKSKEASNVCGPKKKSMPKKNTPLYGSPLIAGPTILNPPFGARPMNIPPAFMTNLSCATSFDHLLMQQTLPPFGTAPPISSGYASTGYSQFPPPYFFNYPFQPTPPVPPPTANPFTQFVPPPPPSSYGRPPPGFSPLNLTARAACASPCGQPSYAPALPASFQTGTANSDHLHSRPAEPLVTIASTPSVTTNKFEWPLTDPELASQWEKKRKESVTSEDNGCRKDSQENKEELSSLQPTKDPLLASIDSLNLADAHPEEDLSTVQDLIAIEKSRERRGVESALKKCFGLSQSVEVVENGFTFLKAQAKPQSSGAGNEFSPKEPTESWPEDTIAAPKTSQPTPAVPSPPIPAQEPLAADFWQPKSHAQQDDVTFQMNAMLDKLSECSRKSTASTPTPNGTSTPKSRDVNYAGSPLQENSMPASPTNTESASSGVSAKASKKPSKLDSIKQMVMQMQQRK